ncbi:MAG: AAA family ATPase [Desulfobacteraceae bacterium]|nr:AAA family ATPase [Desulfobacteraceae bacterium]
MNHHNTLNEAGYKIQETIYESNNSIVCRAIRAADDKKVILKRLNRKDPTALEKSRFKREFQLAGQLKMDGIIKVYALEQIGTTLMIVMEDFGAESLSLLLPSWDFSLKAKLSIASRIAYHLWQIHQQEIIHLDINPSNIIWAPDTDVLKIIDFGISTQLDRESAEIYNPNVIEGTISYIAPEQTGRMNRMIDYRADLYSLGVTLYELMCGALPFIENDHLSLIHAHIAKKPQNPIKLNPQIPKILAKIILLLMAKDAQKRYQSAYGVYKDLQNCLDQLTQKGSIETFDLAMNDIPSRFQIPQKIYGRKNEIRQLLSAFDRIANGTMETFLIAGTSGIGKSALVGEIHRYIVERKAYFLSCKFGHLENSIPYTPLKQAFKDFVRYLLTEPEEELEKWKFSITENIKPNGKILVEAIPELELIIGPQDPAMRLSPIQEANRFNLVFQNFIKTIASSSHPLVLFLDDLQWVDLPSLKLITNLIKSSEKYILIIGSYRSNEICSDHPLTYFIRTLKEKKLKYSSIELGPLDADNANTLVADSLRCSDVEARALSDFCLSETNGNPFHIHQYIQSLYNEKCIVFDPKNNRWVWDIDKANNFQISNDVVKLMMSKISGLGVDSKELLILASCIGSSFDLKTLSAVGRKTGKQVYSALLPAVAQGLIIPSKNYKFFLAENDQIEVTYKFFHDRVRQCAYDLLCKQDKEKLHLFIGKKLMIDCNCEDEKIFDVIKHFDKSLSLLTKEEKPEIAHLYSSAGKIAQESIAWQSAYEYFKTGMGLLGKQGWPLHYDLMLSLYLGAAECAYLDHKYDISESLLEQINNHAKNVLDRCKSHLIRIRSYLERSRFGQTVDLGIMALAELGVRFPKNPTNVYISAKIILAKHFFKVDQRNPDTLTDPHKLAIAQVLMSLLSPAHISGSKYLILISLKMLELYVIHGHHPQGVLGLVVYGALCSAFGDYDEAYKYGKIALKACEDNDLDALKHRIVFVNSNYIQPYKESFKSLLPVLKDNYQTGFTTGDFEFSAYCATAYFNMHFNAGSSLEYIFDLMHEYKAKVIKQDDVFYYLRFKLCYQSILNLLGKSEAPHILNGELFCEKELIESCAKSKDHMALFEFYLKKIILLFLFGKHSQAVQIALLAEKYFSVVKSRHYLSSLVFYQALCLSADYQLADKSVKKQHLEKIKRIFKKIKKWAFHAPANYKNKLYIIKGELAKLCKKYNKAFEYYSIASVLSEDNQFIHEAAICYELKAQLYLQRGKMNRHRLYLQKAYDAYKKWGAKAKCRQLKDKFTFISEIKASGSGRQTVARQPFQNTTVSLPSSQTESITIDVLSAVKASQALSGEINLDHLLEKLMRIVVENAGAQNGCLWLYGNKNKISVEVIYAGDQIKLQTGAGRQNNQWRQAPVSIINYVTRTQQSLVLINAYEDPRFSCDEYIIDSKLKSALCIPLIRQARLTGLLYLENNEISNAFTPKRVELLKLISSQAAISIENAKLYEMIAKSENRYRSLLENSSEGIFQIAGDGRILIANQAIAAMFGYTSSAELVKALNGTVTSAYSDRKSLQKLQYEIQNKGYVKNYEVKLKHSYKKHLICSLTAHIIFDENGNIVCYEGIIKDITKQREMEKLRLGKEAAEAKTMAKSRFLAHMSHEIRTPINTILGYSELLKNEKDPEQHNVYLKNIIGSGRHLLSLIDDVMEISKIEKGKLSIDKKPMSVVSVFNELEEQYRSETSKNGLNLRVSVSPKLEGLFIQCDKVRFKQIINNLLNNAIKFTPKGSIWVNVELIGQKGKAQALKVIVTDSGIGISDTRLIFREFEQISDDNTIVDGVGLGLAIVKRLVQMLNGKIEVESKPGRGSTFKVTFFDVEFSSEAYCERSLKDMINEEIRFRQATIIIADDNQANRELIKEYLKYQPFKLLMAKNGKELIHIVHNAEADLILMDLRMPQMDGVSVLKSFKEDEGKRQIPVIVITADVTTETKSKVKKIGSDGYLLKPVSKETLVYELKKFLPYDLIGSNENNRQDTKGSLKMGNFLRNNCISIDELLRDLKQIKEHKWNHLKKTMIVSDIENFAQKITGVADKYEFTQLRQWGENLSKHSRSYNIGKMNAIIEEFPEMVHQIENMLQR